MIRLRRLAASTTTIPPNSPSPLHLLSTSAQQLPDPPNPSGDRPAKFTTHKPHVSIDALKRYLSLVKSCFRLSHFLRLHAHLLRTRLFLHHDISLSFFSAAAQVLSPRHITYVRRLFSSLFRRPRLAHYNVIIRAFSVGQSPELFVPLHNQMRRKGVVPNAETMLFSVKCCARVSSISGGSQMHARALVGGHQLDCFLMSGLTEMYSSCGRCEDAVKVFDEITKRDAVAWNVLITCFMRNRRTRDALVLFNNMQSFDVSCKPDDVTFLLVLEACADLCAPDTGKQIHGFIDEHGYGKLTNLCNALVSMYSKCGCLDEAIEVFRRIPNKNVVSWTAIIYGFAINGFERHAIDVFWKMISMAIAPDAHAFTAVLVACSRCGLVDEGIQLFRQMEEEFGIVPNIHHYGCMVELLGRAGLLNQAYDLILSMKIKPDVLIWRTLLGACRLYKNTSLGEVVVNQLVELKAEQTGDFVLLLNIYSSVGNFVKVNELRRYMSDSGIKTAPGCCSIELKGVLHHFAADDSSHPRKDEIYGMIREIGQQLRIAGYVPDVSWQQLRIAGYVPDVSLESHGVYHSEKLAIAFAVLVTPPGNTIRVAKDLQVCADCHSFAKVFSAVYDRKVIIRDQHRLHQFREGSCSCNDYW